MATIRVNRTSANTCNLIVDRNIFRQYWAPAGGGDVRAVTFRDFGIYGKQVAADLSEAGDMLYLPAGAELADMIRAAVKKGGRDTILASL